MADLTGSSSFIPKRTSGAVMRQRRTRNFFLLSILSYACLIAAPTASAAVYVYQLYTERRFDALVTELNNEIAKFSAADMARVLEFDERLKTATALVEGHISLGRAITALEQSTVQKVAFSELEFTRTADNGLTVSGALITTNFDTAMFQRTEFRRDSVPFQTATLTNITFVPVSEDGLGERVNMEGTFTFTPDSIAFEPDTQLTTTPDTTATDVTPAEDVGNNAAANDPAL